MKDSNAVAFGTIPTNANVLGDNVARPGSIPKGDQALKALDSTPLVVGETRPGGGFGQGVAGSAGPEVNVGQVKPGGQHGQGAGESVRYSGSRKY